MSTLRENMEAFKSYTQLTEIIYFIFHSLYKLRYFVPNKTIKKIQKTISFLIHLLYTRILIFSTYILLISKEESTEKETMVALSLSLLLNQHLQYLFG